MPQATTNVNVHLADNLPYKLHDQELVVDIDLVLKSSNPILAFRKESATSSTTYEMKILDTTRLGLTNGSSESDVSAAIEDLILSLNLSVPRAVFLSEGRTYFGTRLVRDPDVQPPDIQKDIHGNITIKVTETVRVTASVKMTLGTKVEIDEAAVLAGYDRIRKARQPKAVPSDFLRAIQTYREGIRNYDRVSIVKLHAASIELAVNAGLPAAKHVDGKDLDQAVAKLSGCSLQTAESIRAFYNRAKHPDRRPADQQAYEQALQNITQLAFQAKTVAGEVIKARLPV